MKTRLAKLAFEHGLFLGLVTLVLYIWLAPAHIVDGDNAELSTLAAFGGVAHPTGYPSYVLWLRAWSWLPAASPAHAASIATAILSAAQMIVLVNACRAWGLRTAAAHAAVIIFAGSPVVLAIYTEAEVFAMNGLVAALVLWFAASGGPLRGTWRCAALALVAGLGLANHVTCALLAPVGVLGVVRGLRETEHRARAAIATLLALLVGLTPYLYLLVPPSHEASWGHAESLRGLVRLVLREEYGGPTAFAGSSEHRFVGANLAAFAQTLGRAWLWVPAVAAVVMLAYRSARAAIEPRWSWWMLAASFVIAGPVLVARFNIEPGVAYNTFVVERFHLLPMLLLVIPAAAAFDAAAASIATRTGRNIPAILRTRVAQGALIVVAVLAVASLSLGKVARAHVPAFEQVAKNAIAHVDRDAVVLGGTDELYAGTHYVQLALGHRTDVYYVHWPLVILPWYRDRLAAHGLAIKPGEGNASVRLAEDVLASGRPLFVDGYQVNILKTLPSYPFGLLYRVLPRGSTPPSLDEVYAINHRVYEAYEFGYPPPGTDDGWPTVIHEKYARPLEMLSQVLGAARRFEEAAWASEVARAIGPQP